MFDFIEAEKGIANIHNLDDRDYESA